MWRRHSPSTTCRAIGNRVREQHDAHNGEIVVALIEDSATVKTFYKEKDRIRLQPENDTMEPIYAINPTILGRVTGLFRSM